jgi:anti-sigma factor RsiW
VDGQLPPDETERALAHVATCPRCAAELAAARAARRALSSAAAEPLEPAPGLTARLLSLAPTTPTAPAVRHDPFEPTTPLPGRSSGALLGRSSGVLRTGLGGAPRSALRPELRTGPGGEVAGHLTSRLLIGSVAGLGLVAASLFSLGARPAVVPSAHPGLALDALGAAAVAAPVPAATSTAGDGWTVPALPTGWAVTATRPKSSGVEVDLACPTSTAVVSERPGRLDVAALAGQPTQEVGGRTVYVLSAEPWHVAWQADDTVVEVVAPMSDEDVDNLVAAFPAAPYDDGVSARIGRGWSVVARALETP